MSMPLLRAVIDRIAASAATLRDEFIPANDDHKARDRVQRMAASAADLTSYLGDNLPGTSATGELRHEIRNRLNHIAGPCQLLQRQFDGTNRERIDAIREMVDEAVSLLDADGRSAASSSRGPVATAAASASPARILVAEDDAENRRLLVEVLTGDGHTVDVAADGVAALEHVHNADLDLLLLDIGLPGINGFEVLEKLKEGGWQTPVVVVTGRRAVDDAVRCIEHGADDFLTKPIQVEILRARVKSCVEKMRLREREFAQFFPPKLARSFARRPSLIYELPSRHADVSVLFCDIRNFTAISERLGPDKTTRWLRAVMHELCELVIENEGVLVDFAGDELMAMWGAPDEVPDHATRACNTAVQILERLPALSAEWENEIGSETDLAIGINSGRALVGHIGTVRKTKYGALGDVVNIGSRVLGATAHMQTRLLISGATRNAIDPEWHQGELRRLCRVRVKNLARPVELYEVTPSHDAPGEHDFRNRYEQALGHYESHSLQQASAILGQLLVDYPDDGPSLMLMSRVVEAMLDDESFEPVWTLSGK